MKKIIALILSCILVVSLLISTIGIVVLADDNIKTAQQIIDGLVTGGAYTQSGDVLKNVSNSAAKFADLTTEQSFVFDFDVKICNNSSASESLQIRLRSKNGDGHTLGYRVNVSKDKITLEKFNDNNWQSTVIQAVVYDFTKTVKVRIAANESNLFIALDNYKKIEITDAITVEDGWLKFYGFTTECEVQIYSLQNYSDTIAQAGIKISTDISSADDLTTALVNSTAYTQNGDVLNNVGESANKYATFTDKQDFVLDFTAKHDSTSNTDDYIQLRLRTKNADNHSFGYRLYIYKDKIAFEKFNDDNWRSTLIQSATYDFTKTVKVRLVANGANIWIALDNVKKIEITDAVVVDNGTLQFYGATGQAVKEISIISLKKYSEKIANDGITDIKETEPDAIVTKETLLTLMDGNGWKRADDTLVSSKIVNYGTILAQTKNFVLDFDIRIAPSDMGELQVRFRHSYNSVCNLGYRLGITNNQLVIAKYNDNNFQFTPIKNEQVDFTSTKHIKIAANDSMINVYLNNKLFTQIKNAYNDSDRILLQSTFKADTVIISNFSLLKYSVEAEQSKAKISENEKIEYSSSEMMSISDILKLFEKNGYKCADNSAIATSDSKGKGVNLGNIQNFILDYDIKFNPSEAGSVMMKFRHYYKDANFGYILNFSKKSTSLTRYKEQNNGSQDNLGMTKIDFTKGAHVRVVANGGLVWVAVNNEKIFEIKNAVEYIGQIQFLHLCESQGVTFSNITLKSYEENASYEGMSNRNLKDLGPTIYKDFEVTSQADAEAAFYGRFDYIYKDGRHALCIAKDWVGAETHIVNDVKNFVMQFELNLDELAKSNRFIINFRKGNFDGYSLGYQLSIGQDTVSIAAWTGEGWVIGDILDKSPVVISGWTKVKIVVCDSRLCVFINEQLIMDFELEYTELGFISIQNIMSKSKQIYFSNVSLTDYYEGAIPAGAQLVSMNKLVKGDDKAVSRPVNLPVYKTKGNANNKNKVLLSIPIIILIIIFTVLAVIGVVVLLYRKKKNN